MCLFPLALVRACVLCSQEFVSCWYVVVRSFITVGSCCHLRASTQKSPAMPGAVWSVCASETGDLEQHALASQRGTSVLASEGALQHGAGHVGAPSLLAAMVYGHFTQLQYPSHAFWGNAMPPIDACLKHRLCVCADCVCDVCGRGRQLLQRHAAGALHGHELSVQHVARVIKDVRTGRQHHVVVALVDISGEGVPVDGAADSVGVALRA